MPKVKRDAFLYLDPVEPKDEFAQCKTCTLYARGRNRCSIMGSTVVKPGDSCGFYVPGTPPKDIQGRALVTAKEAGLVHREVRCENCEFFKSKKSKCGLFGMLNKELPDTFDLDEAVDKYGCCNANTPITESKPARQYGKGD